MNKPILKLINWLDKKIKEKAKEKEDKKSLKETRRQLGRDNLKFLTD